MSGVVRSRFGEEMAHIDANGIARLATDPDDDVTAEAEVDA
ncbi:MAG TPA: hypothetical protein VJQ47_09660 [Steroidobacteraceae bacterium]|nr:hypothetical protein [Steroidobacteraceae bacterium]